ncbi:MAG: hypothetical protein ACLGI6_18320 [Gammaproteobacteria bacterium]
MATLFSRQWMRAHGAKVLVVAGFGIPAFISATGTLSGNGGENRTMAALPPLTMNVGSVLAYPAQLDSWINDHFGGRGGLIKLNNRVRYYLLREFSTVQMISGRNGRVFLAAHGANQPPYAAILDACGPGPQREGQALSARYLNTLIGDYRQMGFKPVMMIVPSAPVVEHQDLPAWIGRRCATDNTPVRNLIDSPLVEPAVRASILYPLAEMRYFKQDTALFPKRWFHWSGPGLARVVDLTMPRLVGPSVPNVPALPTQTAVTESDVGHLFGGVHLRGPVTTPDFAAAGINACYGVGCYPEFGSAADKLIDVSRFTNPKAPIARRLLILSDSFGSKIAGWYARYYQRIEHVAGNDIPRLDQPELDRVRAYLLRAPQDTDLLILYHDGGAINKAIRNGMRPLHSGKVGRE